jgi:hypothetical protein
MTMHARHVTRLFGTALVACASGVVNAGNTLTTADALAVVNASEAAAKQHDHGKVGTFMSGDCVVSMATAGGSGAKQKSGKQYVQDELDAERHATDHVYQSTAPQISLEDGKAIARLRVTETFTEQGHRVEGVADEVETLELRDGHVLITRIDVTPVSMTVDGTRAL